MAEPNYHITDHIILPTPVSVPITKKQIEYRSKVLLTAFTPVRIFLTLIGQMPYETRRKKSGLYVFKFNIRSSHAAFFCLIFLASATNYIMVSGGILSFMMRLRYAAGTHIIMVKDTITESVEPKLWERYIIRKEMVGTIVVWAWMTTAFTGNLFVLMNGKTYVHFMNYFNRAFHIMEIDLSSSVRRYLYVNNIVLLLVALLLITGFVLQFIGFTPVANASSVLANFSFRLLGVEIIKSKYFFGYQLLGLVMMIYALVGSRANIIQFLYYGQLLKNLATVWNQRLTRALKHDFTNWPSLSATENEQSKRRVQMELILKDHVLLVQLFQMTENLFSTILVAYYFLQICSIVMEIYQIAALGGFTTLTASTNDDFDIQSYDIEDVVIEDEVYDFDIKSTAFTTFCLLLQNSIICYLTTVDAAQAYETAMKGFEILRKNGFMNCRTERDKNFVMSLFLTFARNTPLQISPGGYFSVTKALLATLITTIVEWSISIYQTRVDQWE